MHINSYTSCYQSTAILTGPIRFLRYRDPNYVFHQLLRPEEIKQEEKLLIAIDTEFVALSRVS